LPETGKRGEAEKRGDVGLAEGGGTPVLNIKLGKRSVSYKKKNERRVGKILTHW